MNTNQVAYWRYPQPTDGRDAAPNGPPNEHRAWRIVRQLRAENAALAAERDWWRVACCWALAVALLLASMLLLARCVIDRCITPVLY